MQIGEVSEFHKYRHEPAPLALKADDKRFAAFRRNKIFFVHLLEQGVIVARTVPFAIGSAYLLRQSIGVLFCDTARISLQQRRYFVDRPTEILQPLHDVKELIA